METVVVTGASRGMGLEFSRQYLARGARVFAGYRNKDTAAKLEALKAANPERLTLVELDVSDQDSIKRSRDVVAGMTDHVDVLVNNAGLGGIARSTGKQEQLGTFDFEDCWVVLRTMAVGPLLMAQEYLELLKKSGHAKIGNVTSGYGSIGANNGFPYYYSAAKSALHQLMRSLVKDVKPYHIAVNLMDPGWVQTDMGGPNAPLPVDQSIGGMIKRMDELTLERSGEFISWDGKPRPW